MIVDGRAIAQDILKEVRAEVEALGVTPIVRAITLAPSPATRSYLRIKEQQAKAAGMKLEITELAQNATDEEIISAIRERGADALIVQLPLPSHIDAQPILNAIPAELDADVLSQEARSAFEENQPEALLPPVVGAIKEILERSGVEALGKSVVVLGRGWLVGDPIAKWLVREGAQVATFGQEDFDATKLKEANIIISGVGQAGLVKKEFLMEEVVLIDAGTSESGGAIAGDIDPDCAEIASIFTPVPGGVGPVAVARLFKNVLELRKASSLQMGAEAV